MAQALVVNVTRGGSDAWSVLSCRVGPARRVRAARGGAQAATAAVARVTVLVDMSHHP